MSVFDRIRGKAMPSILSDEQPNAETSGALAREDVAISELKLSMRKTAQSRFAAAKRLQSRDRKITRLTALASAYLIGLTAIPYFLRLPVTVENHVNLVALVVAVIVLVSSLLQYSRADVASAEQHHRCGLEINEVLRTFDGPGIHRYDELVRGYNEILQKYSINHDDIDFWAVMLDRPHEYSWLTGWSKFYRRAMVALDWYGPDIILAITSVALAIFVAVYVFPAQLAADARGISLTITPI